MQRAITLVNCAVIIYVVIKKKDSKKYLKYKKTQAFPCGITVGAAVT